MKRRPGFTQIECLTVAAAAVLLLSALLPAVQLAREDARMVQCQNNLKQLALACHNYHDVYNRFPNGWISRRIDGEGHFAAGWQARLLPYMGQAPLYNQLKWNVTEDKANEPHFKTVVKRYLCPLDAYDQGLNPMRGGWAASSYTGNYGSIPIPRWSLSTGADMFWPGNLSAAFLSQDWKSNPDGIFQMNHSIGFRDIVDGTSNTILAGERTAIGGGAIWGGVRSNIHESDVVSDGSYASPVNRSDTGYSSRHPGVFNLCLCDGSVRAVSVSMDSKPEWGILQMLSSRGDGHAVGEF